MTARSLSEAQNRCARELPPECAQLSAHASWQAQHARRSPHSNTLAAQGALALQAGPLAPRSVTASRTALIVAEDAGSPTYKYKRKSYAQRLKEPSPRTKGRAVAQAKREAAAAAKAEAEAKAAAEAAAAEAAEAAEAAAEEPAAE